MNDLYQRSLFVTYHCEVCGEQISKWRWSNWKLCHTCQKELEDEFAEHARQLQKES